MSKKLVSQNVIDAYQRRFQSMKEHNFTKEGDELFITKLVVESEQLSNLHVRATIDKFAFDNDEPKELGGTNLAPNPMQSLLAAFANCLEISGMLYLSFSNVKVKSLKVKVEATYDKRSALVVKEAPLPGFYEFSYTWYVDTDEPLSKVKRVLKKVERNCQVRGTLARIPQFSEDIVLL